MAEVVMCKRCKERSSHRLPPGGHTAERSVEPVPSAQVTNSGPTRLMLSPQTVCRAHGGMAARTQSPSTGSCHQG